MQLAGWVLNSKSAVVDNNTIAHNSRLQSNLPKQPKLTFSYRSPFCLLPPAKGDFDYTRLLMARQGGIDFMRRSRHNRENINRVDLKTIGQAVWTRIRLSYHCPESFCCSI